MKTFTNLLFAIFISMNANAQQVRDFTLKDINGNEVSYSSIKGEKLTVIDFWATWCKFCLKAIPEINKLNEEYKTKGVSFVGLSNDGPRSVSKVAPMSKSMNISYPILLDTNSDIANDLQVSALPTLMIVDSNNKVLWIHQGYAPGDELEIKKQIDILLNSN